jgi:hypothetical protein
MHILSRQGHLEYFVTSIEVMPDVRQLVVAIIVLLVGWAVHDGSV